MSTTHTAVFENAILKSTELKADTKIAVGLDTEQTTKELTVVGDAPEIRIQDKTGSNPEVNQTTLSIVADGGVTHFRAGTSTFDTTETKGDIKFQSSTGDSTHAIITGTGRIGVGTTAPTESLDIVGNINLQKVSNTATIKLDSNVVTEYARSKKLIKYPRVALTAATTAGYVASSSTTFVNYYPWEAFDNYNPVGGNSGQGAGWASQGPAGGTDTYDASTGAETLTTTHHTGSPQGEWIQIQMPDSIYLHDISIHSRSETNYTDNMTGFPKNVYLYGSNDNSNWTILKNFTTASKTLGASHTESIDYAPGAFKYFALVINSIHVSGTDVGFTSIGQIEFYGTPEYDPEAHGTDTIMRSIPNVPNTDWLEVYWDGQDYTSMPATVTDKSGNGATGTPNGGVGFDTEYKAFTFDGVDDYISGTLNNTGDFSFTVSIWFYETASNTHTLWMIGSGSSSDNPNPSTALAIDSTGSLDFFIFSGLECRLSTFRATYGTHKWHNVVCTRVDKTLKYFINGVQQNITLTGADEGLSLAANTVFNIGARTGNQLGQNPFQGSIANFRLFNRALTGDEVWQLYAYQKEYFGHGNLGMTLKGGRLGIGTSEPMALLDVRGDIHGGCPVFFSANRSSAIAGAQDVVFNKVHYNKGSGYSGTTGKFTAPLSGYYKFNWHDLTQNSANATQILPYINNNAVTLPNSSADRYGVYDQSLDSVYRNMAGSWIVYLNTGDTFHIRMIEGNLNSNFNCFNGFYLSS